jgi:hypothetical protein
MSLFEQNTGRPPIQMGRTEVVYSLGVLALAMLSHKLQIQTLGQKERALCVMPRISEFCQSLT